MWHSIFVVGLTLTRCHGLRDLEFDLPYQTSAMVHLVNLLSKMSETKCSILRLNFERHSRRDSSLLEPSKLDWASLDDTLQRSEWKSLVEVGVDRNTLKVSDDTEFTWGNTYHWESCGIETLEEWCTELKGYLPLTYEHGKLRYDLDKDATWVPL